MLKIKTLPGNIRNNELVVLDCEDYPGPTENEWHVFLWLLERSVITNTLELCGRDGLTTVLNSQTTINQNRFVNMLPLEKRCALRLKILDMAG